MTNPTTIVNNPLHTILTSYTANDLLNKDGPIYKSASHYSQPPANPISLDGNLSVKDACLILSNNKISSAPITVEGAFVGQLDMNDMVTHVLEVLNSTPIDSAGTEWGLGELLAQTSQTNHPLKSLSRKNPLIVINQETPLLDVVEEFVRAGAHRVAVVDKTTGSFLGVISQSAIASLIVGQFGLRKATPSTVWEGGLKSIKEAGIIQSKIISLAPEAIVMEALFQMNSERISSIAIVNQHNGRMVGSISISDVKIILAERYGWKKLFYSCEQFFKHARLQQSNEKMGEATVPNYTVKPSSSVINVLEKLVATKSHRVWVADEDEKLIGLVSLSSIIPLLLK